MIHGIGLNRGLINDIQILNNTISLDGNLHAIDMSEQIWAGAINGLATRIEIKNNIFTNCETGIETDTSSAQSGTIAQYNFFDDNLSGSDTAGSAPITLDSTNFHDGDGDNSGSLILDADNKYFSLLPESVAVDGATFFPEIQKTGWTDNPYCMPDYSARERLSGSKPDLGACELTQHKLYMLNSPGPWYLGNDYTDFCYGVFGNNIQYGTNPVSGLGTLPNGTLRRVALGDCIMNKGQICVWVQDAHDSSHEVNFVIYDDDASGGEPSTLLYESGKFYDASTADPNGKIVCKDFELSEHLSGNVWTGVLFEHGDSEYGNAGRENNGRYDAISSFDPAPDPWDHAGDGDSSLERTIYLNF